MINIVIKQKIKANKIYCVCNARGLKADCKFVDYSGDIKCSLFQKKLKSRDDFIYRLKECIEAEKHGGH